jgi:hypothetical protein
MIMSLTLWAVMIAVPWLGSLVIWLSLHRRTPLPGGMAPDLRRMRRAQARVGWAIVVIMSATYLGTSLRHAFGIPERISPTQGWLYVVGWNAVVSVYVDLVLLRRYFERVAQMRSTPTQGG